MSLRGWPSIGKVHMLEAVQQRKRAEEGNMARKAAIDVKYGPYEFHKRKKNDPCWCGSGKKYASCHRDWDMRQAAHRAEQQCGRFG